MRPPGPAHGHVLGDQVGPALGELDDGEAGPVAVSGNALLLRFRVGDRSWPGELRFDANMALVGADVLPPAN